MPFNPGQFVFQPRPLQQFDFGQGFRDLANARYNRQQVENEQSRQRETTAQRQDTNSLNAANFAKDRREAEHKTDADKYQERLKLVEAGHRAAQSNDQAAAEALIPMVTQLGGIARREPNGDYYFEAGPAPTRGDLDIPGARSEIFGGGGPKMGQPFQMPGPGGLGGSMFSDRNPFESPATPGASAAAAGPLPEEQPEQLGGSPMGATPPGAPPVDPQVTSAQNPLNPPAFSPYRVNMEAARTRNQLQLQPYFEGLQKAVPGRFGERMGAFTEGAGALGFSPEKTLSLTQPQLQEMTGLWRGELAAEGQAGRLAMQQGAQDQREEDRRFANDLKLKDRAYRNADKVVQLQSLQKTNEKYQAGKDAEDLLKSAIENPTSATALIEQLYRMRNTGVMTDTDFTHAKEGIVSLHQAVKNGIVELFLKEHGGLNPDTVKMVKEYLDIAMQGHRRKLMSARDGLYRMYKSANTDVEREAYEDKMRGFFSEEFFPAEFNGGVSPGEYMGPGDEPAESAPPPSDNLGRSPVPRTLSGGPKVSPNGVPLVPGRIGPKPPRDPKKLTDQQLDAANEDELMEMLRGASGAP